MIEQAIVTNLLFNEDYTHKVIPYLKDEYFEDPASKALYKTIHEYYAEYRESPSVEALKVALDNRKDLTEQVFKEVVSSLKDMKHDSATNTEWLLNETEKFCQDRDLHNSIRKAIMILDGQEKTLDKGSIPKILSDSLSICFDTTIGHNYLDDAEERYEYYHREEIRLPFDIELFNKITQGGLPPKSLTCFLGGTGAGKSLVMAHFAATNFMHGKNVLYVTLELSEKEIGRRIDANLLDVKVSDIKSMSKEEYDRKISRVKNKSMGSLTIKEFPTGTMNANHLRHVLNEIKSKQGIAIDVVYLDYINLCSSFRIKNSNANSYTIVKSIAEEIRGLAMEYDIPIVTATQMTRSGIGNSDVEMSDTSESIGLVYSVDAFFALITGEELEQMGQLLIKQLKNRWGDLNYYRKFTVGIDRSKMRLYNLESSAQENFVDSKPVFDKSKFGERVNSDTKPSKKMFDIEDLS